LVLRGAINKISVKDSGQRVFKTLFSFRVVTYVSLLASVSSGVYYFITDNPTRDALPLLSLMIAALAIPMAIFVLGHEVIVGDDGIIVKSLLRKNKKILFSEIISLKYSDGMKWYTVKAKSGVVRHISLWINGSQQLIELIRSKIK
jgi:hypothetical protein